MNLVVCIQVRWVWHRSTTFRNISGDPTLKRSHEAKPWAFYLLFNESSDISVLKWSMLIFILAERSCFINRTFTWQKRSHQVGFSSDFLASLSGENWESSQSRLQKFWSRISTRDWRKFQKSINQVSTIYSSLTFAFDLQWFMQQQLLLHKPLTFYNCLKSTQINQIFISCNSVEDGYSFLT